VAKRTQIALTFRAAQVSAVAGTLFLRNLGD
jgi:hypothetical protein